MKIKVISGFLVFCSLGCTQYKRLVGADPVSVPNNGVYRMQPIGKPIPFDEPDPTNLLSNPYFRKWSAGSVITNPWTDDPLCAGWKAMVGGDGAWPDFKVSEDPEGVRFDVLSYQPGPDRRGVRITQALTSIDGLRGKRIEASIEVKTNIHGHVQFALDSGIPGDHLGHEYSAMAEGTGNWETITVRWQVPEDSYFVWMKVGMTSGFHPEPGWFIVRKASLKILP